IEALSRGIMDDPALTARFAARSPEDTEPNHPDDDLDDNPPTVLEEPKTAAAVASGAPGFAASTSGASKSGPSLSGPTKKQPVQSRKQTPQGRTKRTSAGREPATRTSMERDVAQVRRRNPRPDHVARHRPTPPAGPETLRRRRLVTLVMLIILTIGGTGAWWMLDGRYVTTPTMAGMARADAEAAAQSLGLELDTSLDFSETVPAGVVISTEPGAGADVLRGGQVSMVVSQGPERFAMPRVIGMSKDDAAKMLAQANLAVGTVKEAWHEELAPGLVIQTSADSGTPMRRGAEIDLTLSKGPRPIQVPNQTGQPVDQAKTALENAGFVVVVKTGHSPSVPEGHVASQNPSNGTAHRGRTITIVRSLGPSMVKVPDVRALPTQEATDQLTRAGFKVETKHGDNFLNLGYAQRTDPDAGQEAPEGSVITLFVI
ncbi:MAG: PASTA domain-containing protein, partial [Propionibacteriaceae bacterium]|nr:PASTA domain-containing protein [Propionibacteriaceae bacterium]